MIGKVISHYRILEKLGGGGMGVVYKGRDTLLDRSVALKVLSPQLLADETAARGFIREAKAASALNHPNILTVLDLVETEGVHFLVMELVEGETLRTKIGKKGMELRPLLEISLEIAEALAAAHKAGIVHRDLKSENIMVRADGHIKVVDFGLAKLLPTAPNVLATGESTVQLPGVAPHVSGVGVEQTHIAGTLPYMSPEQITSKPIDHRTDIYSFGVVLYEMATGQQPHQGGTTTELIDSILTKEPRPVTELSRVVPEKLQEIVAKTLEKDPTDRYQHMEDLGVDLRRIQRASGSVRGTAALPVPRTGAGKPQDRSRWRRWAGAGALAVLLVALGLGFTFRAPLPPPKIVRYVQLTNDGRPKDIMPFGTDLRLLTDGTRLYFLEGGTSGIQITQVALTGGETAPVGAPSDSLVPADISPTNPDLLVAYLPSDDGTGGGVGIMSVTGGSIKPLSGIAWSDGAFSPDGKRIVHVPGHDLYVADSDGSNSKKLLTVKGYLGEPRFSHDASRLRFTVYDKPLGKGGIWEASADGANLHPVLPAWEKDGSASCCGHWTIDGKYFLFLARRAERMELWAIREKQHLFERVNTEPVQLTAGTLHLAGFVPGRDGKHIYAIGIQNKGELERYDSKSKQFLPYLSGMDVSRIDISKDGQWVTYVATSERRLWRRKTDGSGEMALTSSPIQADMPRWSPDGTQIAFAARTPKNQWHIFVTRREAGFPEQLTNGNCDEGDPSWSPDGSQLVFACTSGEPAAPIHMIDLKKNQVTDLPGSNWFISPVWSPNGRYIAALSADSNELKLFDLRSRKWESSIPIQRGEYYSNPSLNWSSDGSYIYFRSHEAGAHGLSRVRINDRKVERILSFGNLRRYSSWMGLDPSDAPLIVAEKGTEEIYALEWEAP